MEMRAREDTAMSRDLTPPIPPIAASLHEKFLLSHCSSCFRPLPSFSCSTSLLSTDNLQLCCPNCSSVHYCSPDCTAADSDRHISSGECRLFLLAPSFSGDTSDVRAALRLLHSFDCLGLLLALSDSPRRIGGLLVNHLVEAMEEDGEMAERIREGAVLMTRARSNKGVGGIFRSDVSIEEEVLWAVMTNAVDVETGELGAIGVAVYGPCFSWFNHSCVPNACYRFELSSDIKAFRPCERGSFEVYPAGSTGEEIVAWKMLNFVESSLAHGLCLLGPRIIICNIKPLKKDDEVCIAYTDLLQPKAFRHLDLWSKYHFICHCERCCRSPEIYIDYVLRCDARNLNSVNRCNSDSQWVEIADYFEEVIAEFMLDGNSETCCRKLDNMLSGSFHCKPSEVENALETRFMLHPLHFLSLKAYIALSSAYQIQACDFHFNDLSEGQLSKNFKMALAASAFSLLMASATHHLFMSETSIIGIAAVFWITAGERLLSLVEIVRSSGQSVRPSLSLRSSDHHFTIREDQPKSQEDLLAASARYINSFSGILKNLWSFLTHGHSYLESVENPANFIRLGIANSYQIHTDDGDAARFGSDEFSGRISCQAEHILDENGLQQLVVNCLLHGRYLANICYGPECHLTEKATDLLGRIQQVTML